jgi:hypothetical protein
MAKTIIIITAPWIVHSLLLNKPYMIRQEHKRFKTNLNRYPPISFPHSKGEKQYSDSLRGNNSEKDHRKAYLQRS